MDIAIEKTGNKNLEITRQGDCWILKGNATYEHRHMLRDITHQVGNGSRYNGIIKGWEFYCKQIPMEIADLLNNDGEVKVELPREEAKPKDEPKPEPKVEKKIEPKDDYFIKPSWWDRLVRYLEPEHCRPAIAIVGPAGNGKTAAAEAVCEALGYEYVVIDATEYLEPADLVGATTYEIKDGVGREVWRDGKVTQAMRSGKAVIINEFDALNPRAALCLQSIAQDAGPKKLARYITTPGCSEGDRVYPTGDCPLIATMNTYGSGPDRQYVGRNAMDAATMDRWTIISTGYENESKIIEGRGYTKDTAKSLQAWAEKSRKKIEDNGVRVILSMRTLLRIAEVVEVHGMALDKAIDEEFTDRLPADVRELLVEKKAAEFGKPLAPKPISSPFGRR